jgi:endonuclease III
MKQLGGRFCRTARPRCDGCPLEPFLPEGGAREIDA